MGRIACWFISIEIVQILYDYPFFKNYHLNVLTGFTATQELKVLVDLALISAGESDMETDRISSLHTSCLGFAPLIFDLRESEEQKVNFDDLVKACDPVWKAVETDPSLPQKLVRSGMHFMLFDIGFLFSYV